MLGQEQKEKILLLTQSAKIYWTQKNQYHDNCQT